MKLRTAAVAAAALADLCGIATAQSFTLNPGELEFRIVADSRYAYPPFDATFQFALQVSYTGGDDRVASLGATRGRIVSNEPEYFGILERASVRQAPLWQ